TLRHGRKESAVNVRHRVHQEQFFRSFRHAGEYSKGQTSDSPFRGVRLLSPPTRRGRAGCFPGGPFPIANPLTYCLLGLLASGLDSPFCSGLPAAGCLASPCEPACASETSNIRVPLSRRTFLPVEVITEPCVAFDAAAFRFRPFRPNTPWLFELIWPEAF